MKRTGLALVGGVVCVIPAAAAAAPANADATLPNVKTNVVLLIGNGTNGVWFAAGLLRLGDD